MFPKAFFPGSYFAALYWPPADGAAPTGVFVVRFVRGLVVAPGKLIR